MNHHPHHGFGGDPQAIVLAGESAGAAHVAAAVLMRCFLPQDWKIAGAFLLSGPYDAQLERMARGTEDESLAAPLAQFVKSCAARSEAQTQLRHSA